MLDDEPSMDDILASIRQIISEDENSASSRSEFSHPSQVSNANTVPQAAPAPEPDVDLELDDGLEEALQAAVAQELAASDAIAQPRLATPPPTAAQTPSIPATAPAVPSQRPPASVAPTLTSSPVEPTQLETPILPTSAVEQVAALQPSAPVQTPTAAVLPNGQSAPSDQPRRLDVPDDVHSRAEKIRHDLGLARANGGMSLEERLEQYRIRGRVRAQGDEFASQAAVPPAAAPTPHYAPPLSTMPTADDVAHAILLSKSLNASEQISELMRPVIHKWLSDNLPGLVERLVRAEIDRVSKGRTG